MQNRKNFVISKKDCHNVYYRIFNKLYKFLFISYCPMILSGIGLLVCFFLRQIILMWIFLSFFFLFCFGLLMVAIYVRAKISNRIGVEKYINKNISYCIENNKLFVFENDDIIVNFTIREEKRLDDYIIFYKNERDFFFVVDRETDK